jgi:glycosyltransferase involved in cell wall biosynthesis
LTDLRVLALHLTAPWSSEAKVLASLLDRLEPGVEVKLVTNARAGPAEPSSFERLDPARVSRCPLRVGLPLDPQAPRSLVARAAARAAHLALRRRVLEVARRYRPDVVYTSQQRFDCGVGELVARALAVPHVVHLHYTVVPGLGEHVLRRLVTCDLVLAVSEFVAGQARRHGVHPARLVVLPNALAVDDGAPAGAAPPRAAGRPFTFGLLGRMAPGKGFQDALLAFARVRAAVPAVDLLLVGDGPERPALETLARGAGIAGAVCHVGWQHDVRPWLDATDVLVFPSRDEPFGLAVLEAAAAARPTVAYDEGGVRETVVSGETGLLVPAGDVAALAAAMRWLHDHPRERAAMGRAARARVATRFDPAAAARVFCESLRRVCGCGARRGIVA